ncbi:MAG: tyrosine-type recombinase/integrase [Aestuariibacter sp.]|nr:tyrosine-type recombinase/integrase [Aestuariibacter sp.]
MLLKNLFSESVLKQLHAGPLASHLSTFTSLLSEQGYTKFSIKVKIRFVAKLSRWLDQQHLGVNDLKLELFDHFIKYRGTTDPIRRGDLATLKLLLQHVNEKGVIQFSAIRIDKNPFLQIEDGFAQYLSHERGLSPETLITYIPLVRCFLSNCFKADTIRLEKLCPKDITAFILSYTQSVKRSTAKLMVTSLRAFFRYLRFRGQIATDLAAFVPAISDWRLTGLPKSLEPEQIECLLKSCDQNTKVGQRDFTILLLLARLGLRAGEIVKMTLDDINWDVGELIIRGKGPRKDKLPIPYDVGEALAAYLQHGRPACPTRCVFIRARAPYQCFSSSVAICNIVQRALLRAKINSSHKGAHLLRHSLATNMLRKGASLTEIGEILRHQLPNTTELYTKVDIVSLRSLAQPWLGGEI